MNHAVQLYNALRFGVENSAHLFYSRSNAIILKRGKDHDKDPSIEFVGRSGGFCCS